MTLLAPAMTVNIDPARWPAEVALTRELFLEYADWLDFDLCFQGFDQELDGLPGGYAPPDGGVWFARTGEGAGRETAGVAGLRPFGETGRADAVCEMKRLWVRPAYRGLGLGRRLARQTLEAARAAGYQRLRLDTLPRMTRARGLYAGLGFRDVTATVADPHPELIYMELDLTVGSR